MIDPSQTDFATLSDMVRQHAQRAPERLALADGAQTLSYSALDKLLNRVAAALQRDGVKAGDSIAMCAQTSVSYAAAAVHWLGGVVGLAPGFIHDQNIGDQIRQDRVGGRGFDLDAEVDRFAHRLD